MGDTSKQNLMTKGGPTGGSQETACLATENSRKGEGKNKEKENNILHHSVSGKTGEKGVSNKKQKRGKVLNLGVSKRTKFALNLKKEKRGGNLKTNNGQNNRKKQDNQRRGRKKQWTKGRPTLDSHFYLGGAKKEKIKHLGKRQLTN